MGERIAFPSHELVTTLAFAAAATERVRIVPTVAVLPTHETVRFAKQMATVDVLSGGRLTVGVGVGGREDDYRAVGAPFAGRFARLDEQVALMQRVWRGEAVVDGLPAVGPEPVQPGGPPLLSAAMGPKSMARTAAWAHGIAGFDLAPDPAGVDGLFRRAEAAWTGARAAPTGPGWRRARGSRSGRGRRNASTATPSTTSRTSGIGLRPRSQSSAGCPIRASWRRPSPRSPRPAATS